MWSRESRNSGPSSPKHSKRKGLGFRTKPHLPDTWSSLPWLWLLSVTPDSRLGFPLEGWCVYPWSPRFFRFLSSSSPPLPATSTLPLSADRLRLRPRKRNPVLLRAPDKRCFRSKHTCRPPCARCSRCFVGGLWPTCGRERYLLPLFLLKCVFFLVRQVDSQKKKRAFLICT